MVIAVHQKHFGSEFGAERVIPTGCRPVVLFRSTLDVRYEARSTMVVFCVVLGASALGLMAYFLWSRRRFYKVAWQLRGPVGLPFIGLGLNMMNPETFLQYMEGIAKQYQTPFISWMGTKCFLYVNDPGTVETVFNSPHCTNKGDFYRFMASAIGDGLFTSSSPRWNKHRRLINPAFSRQVINNFLPIFNAEADVLLDKFATNSAQPSHEGWLEIYELLKKSVLETACQTTMGRKMNFQNDGSALIFDSYNGVTEVCVKRMLSPWLYPDAVYRWSALFARQLKVVNVLFGFVGDLLKQGSKSTDERVHKTTRLEVDDDADAIADSHSDSDGSDNDNGRGAGVRDGDINVDDDVGEDVSVDDIIGGNTGKCKAIFVEQVRNSVKQGQLSWEDVRDEANVIVAATFETTSTALYLVCLCLAMHPQYQDKLYEELVELFPVEGAAKVTNELLESMPYTEMVISEAMRLFAPVPMVLRSASADFRLRNGVVIPRGTQIGIDIYNMQRSTAVWGAQAGCYRPELHFGAHAPARPASAFAYIPFTKGLRMCIGYRYALMLMKVMVAKIFRNYRIRTDARIEDLVVKGTISLKLREYPLCRLERRSPERSAP